MNKPDFFEKHIKKAVENYEAPFDTEAWDKIENQLPGNSTLGFKSFMNWAIGAVAIAAVVTGFWYFTRSTIPTVKKQDKLSTEQINDTRKIEKENKTIDSKAKKNQTNYLIDENEVDDDDQLNDINSLTKLEKAKASENVNLIPDENNNGAKPVFDNNGNAIINIDDSEDAKNLIVNWFISKDELCPGEALAVSINNVNEPVEILWDFGDGETSNNPKDTHRYANPGIYIIKLKANSLISDNKVYREKKYIEVRANPQANFRIEKSENMELLPEVIFSNSTKYYSHIKWVFDEDRIDDQKSVKKLYRNKGRYNIGLYVSNQFGCSDSIFKEVVIENDYNLMAPSAFTPNDDGMNDSFIPKALTFLGKKFNMQIISKNGKVVFESKNIETPWNGKLNNSGPLLDNGSYAWTVKLEDGSIYSGTVILMIE